MRTFPNLEYGKLVKIDLLSMRTQSPLCITEEIFLDGCLAHLLHEYIVPVNAAP